MLQRIKGQIKLLKEGPFDTSTSEGRAKERARSMALTALTAMLAKCIAMITPLVTVRITLTYLGEEIYGLWSTVTTFFALFTYADLGLGSGLQTELSHASALDDANVCRKLVSTTYTMLAGVCVALLCVFALAYPFVNWSEIVNAQTSEAIELAGKVVIAIVIPKIINVPLALIQRTQNAMQEGYRTNLWQICGYLMSLLFVILISICNGGKTMMMAASSSIVVVVATLNMVVYFTKQRPELRPSLHLFDFKVSKSLLSTGLAFFVLSIFTSIGLSIDTWVVAQTSSLADATPYSIMLKMSNMINIVATMLSTPLWAANGEALERGEVDWVKKKTKDVVMLSLFLSAAFSLCLIVFCKPVLWLLTDNRVSADFVTLIGMCILNVLIAVTSPYFMILNSSRVITFQIATYIVYAVISLPLKFFIGSAYGVRFIPWVGAVSYLLLLTIPTFARAQIVLKGKYNCNCKR